MIDPRQGKRPDEGPRSRDRVQLLLALWVVLGLIILGVVISAPVQPW